MRILIIENQEEDLRDIVQCLPEAEKNNYESAISVRECEANSKQYETPKDGKMIELLITDILDLENRNQKYDDLIMITTFTECIKALSRLYKRLQSNLLCDLIIVTKISAIELQKYFIRIQEDIEVKDLFSNDLEDLNDQLTMKNDSPFYLYMNDRVTIVTKPYQVCGEGKLKIEYTITDWRNEMRSLINGIIDSRLQ